MTAPRSGPRPASDRLRRLLLLLPWLMERGEATVEETAARFGISEKHLIADLEKASMCGLPPYVDEMIDLYIDDGVIHMGVPRLFTRPLRLSAREGFAVLAAGLAALELEPADRAGPLERALGKLESALGRRTNLRVSVDQPRYLEQVRAAIDALTRLTITYYSPWRDERSERTISPHAVVLDRGDWYVIADCSLAAAERVFRVDRIESVVVTGETYERRNASFNDGAWSPDDDAQPVTLRLAPEAAWVAERHPVTSASTAADGWMEVTLKVTNERWFARLLVRLGPHVVVTSPESYRDLAARTARAMLDRYEQAPTTVA